MKFNILISLILAVSSVAQAADVGKARKPSKTTVGAKKGNIAYSIEPFDTTVETLPKNYRGHDILDILRKLSPPLEKGEFEKSEEYEARLTQWKGEAFLGKITPADTLAFEISELLAPDAISVKYDADIEEVTTTISFENRYFDSSKARWLEAFYYSKKLGSHIGVTAIGIKFRVTSYLGTSIGLGVKEQISPISISKPMSRDEALRVKHTIKAYAITNLAEPYKINYSKSSNASLDDPSEWVTNYLGLWVNLKAIWLVNGTTGEVIAKVEAPFSPCEYRIC